MATKVFNERDLYHLAVLYIQRKHAMLFKLRQETYTEHKLS